MNTEINETAPISIGQNHMIDLDKIKTVDDIKYLVLTYFNVHRNGCLYLNENCEWFDKLKHLIKEEP